MNQVAFFDNLFPGAWDYQLHDNDVRAAMHALDAGHLADLLQAKRIREEFGPHDLPVKLSRPLGGGLFEFKLRGEDTTARVFYCFLIGRRVIYLQAFIKKSQKTPEGQLKAARRKMAEALLKEKVRLAEEAAEVAKAKKEGKDARR